MAVHEIPIQWHDILEDPSDLPKVRDGYGKYFMCTIENRNFTPARSSIYEEVWWNSSTLEWYLIKREDDGYIAMQQMSKYPFLRVIAWAEKPSPYKREE